MHASDSVDRRAPPGKPVSLHVPAMKLAVGRILLWEADEIRRGKP
jgi:hypothetical protein